MSTTVTAQYFVQTSFAGDIRGTDVFTATLFDEDLIRGDDTGERIEDGSGFPIFDGFTQFVFDGPRLDDVVRVFEDGEVTTTVTFADGTTLSGVLGLNDRQTFNFGVTNNLFLLDQEALASVGKTIEDVASVQIDDFVDHDLSFADLGFSEGPLPPEPEPEPEPDNVAPTAIFDFYQDIPGGEAFVVDAGNGILSNDNDLDGDALTASLVSGPSNGTLTLNADGSFTYTPDDGFSGVDFFTYEASDGELSTPTNVRLEVSAPATSPSEMGGNVISGTDGRDRLSGTDRDDILIGGGDDDRLTGGDGADTFVFGADDRDFDRDRDIITDFDAAEDMIVLEAGAEIRQVFERRGDTYIQLEGDRDLIIVRDADASIVDNIVFAEDTFLV